MTKKAEGTKNAQYLSALLLLWWVCRIQRNGQAGLKLGCKVSWTSRKTGYNFPKKDPEGGVKGSLKVFWKMIQNRLFLPWRSPLYPAVASFPTHAHTEKQKLWNCPEVPTFNRRSPLGINQIDKHLQTVKRFKHHWRKNYESFGRSEKLMTCSPSLPGGWSRLLEFRCLAWVSIQNPPIITCS